MLTELQLTGFRGATNLQIGFAPLTAIIGPEASGKSTLVYGLKFAVNAPSRVGPYGRDDSNEMRCLAVFGSGNHIGWQSQRKGAGWTTPTVEHAGTFNDPSLRSIAANMVIAPSELLDAQPPKQRAAVIARFGGVDELPTPELMDEHQAELWEEFKSQYSRGTPVETLAAIADCIRPSKTAFTKIVNEARSKLDAARKDTAGSGAEMLPALRAELNDVQDNFDCTDANGISLRKRVQELEMQERKQSDDIAAQRGKLQIGETLLRLAESALGMPSLQCPVCSSDTTPEKMKSCVHPAVLGRRKSIAEACADLEVTQTQLNAVRLAFGQKRQERINELRNGIITIEAASQQVGDVEALEAAWRKALDRRRALDDLGAAVTQLLGQILQGAKAEAEATVNMYMPDGRIAVFDMDKGWLVDTDDGQITAKSLAESERCSMLLALALAWTHDLAERILVLDDNELKGFSATGVKSYLLKLGSLVQREILTQVIVTRHADRADEIPGSYATIRFGEAPAQEGKHATL